MRYRKIALGTLAWTSLLLLSSAPSYSQPAAQADTIVKTTKTVQKKAKKQNSKAADSNKKAEAEKTNSSQLNPVVIESKIETLLNAPTVLTDRVTAKEITGKQVDNVNDISRLDPSIDYNSINKSFNIRGLDGYRVLTTVDDIPVPWLNDGARGVKGGVDNFDFSSLSTLDIIRGADSSLYGSRALGGVVMLRTLDPENLITDEKNWGALTKGSYDTQDKSWHIDQAFAVKANNTYALFQGGYAIGKQRANNGDRGGFGDLRTLSDPANFDLTNFMFKVYQHINDGDRIGITAERYNYDNDVRAWSTTTRNYKPGSATNTNHMRRERVSMSYDYNGGGMLDAANAVIYWQKQDLVEGMEGYRIKDPLGLFKRDNSMHETNYGITGKGVKVLEFENVRHTIKFSSELAQSKFSQYSAGVDNCPPPPYGRFTACGFLVTNQSDSPDVESNSFGFALEDEIGFLNGALRFTPGGRFDWYEHMPQKTIAFERNSTYKGYGAANRTSQFSPKLRAEWDVLNKVTLYAQWAQGFRAPTATELFLNYEHVGVVLQEGNPLLKPETSNGYDFGALLGDQQFGGSISFFSNRYRNFIDTVNIGKTPEFVSGILRYTNRAHVNISGVELKGHLELVNGWHTDAGLSYLEGKDSDTDEYLNSIPPLKAVLGIGYAHENWGSDLTLTAAARRDKVAKNSEFAKTPGYTVVDLTGWYQPFGEKGPRLQAGIYNLFNKRYWDAVDLPTSADILDDKSKDYYSEPGRSFKVSFVQKF